MGAVPATRPLPRVWSHRRYLQFAMLICLPPRRTMPRFQRCEGGCDAAKRAVEGEDELFMPRREQTIGRRPRGAKRASSRGCAAISPKLPPDAMSAGGHGGVLLRRGFTARRVSIKRAALRQGVHWP